jgi:hypothetical protein
MLKGIALRRAELGERLSRARLGTIPSDLQTFGTV